MQKTLPLLGLLFVFACSSEENFMNKENKNIVEMMNSEVIITREEILPISF